MTTTIGNLAIRVTSIIAAMAPTPAPFVVPTTRLAADLGYDSVRLVELSIAIEENLGHPALTDEALHRVHTVEDVIAVVTGSPRRQPW